MERIRKGNDIQIKWMIYSGKGNDKIPYDLTDKNIALYVRNAYNIIEITDYVIKEHTIEFTFLGLQQEHLGPYTLTLVENKDQEGMHTVDACDIFSLVGNSCLAGGESESNVECVYLNLQTTADLGVSSGKRIQIDDDWVPGSENPVQSKVIKAYIDSIVVTLKDYADKSVDSIETRIKEAPANFVPIKSINGETMHGDGNINLNTHMVYTQLSASDRWVIRHNMGRNPSVTVVDSAGTEVIGEKIYNNDNQVTLLFSAAFSGKAYLN